MKPCQTKLGIVAIAWALGAGLGPGGLAAETNSPTIEELKRLSLDQLLNQPVSLVSGEPQRISQAPSAVQVLTAEDIQRSGATTLPEALRLAPNLQVAQQDAHDWAITARGFNGAPLANNSLADKLLVMIDGRSVYTPLFGGVFWDVQNVLLADIDHIEVVSGPGASLWGDNAVNGVINVVTKSARDTQGLYASGLGGSFLQDYGAVQYGGVAGSNFFYRVYGQRFDHHSSTLNGVDAQDAWDMSQGGFRVDYYPGELNTFTLQGDIYSGSEGIPTSTRVDGQNILGRWQHTISDTSDLTLQLYLDRTWRDLAGPSFADALKTYDLQVRHHFALGERQDVLWGGEYRLYEDDVGNSPVLSLLPAHRGFQLFSGFVQDEIGLAGDWLKLTVGTKIEHNDFSGFELQPSIRLAYIPTARQVLWAAVSRAVRSPARLDADETTPYLTTPNHDFDSEKVVAYELGYRLGLTDRLLVSAAAFFNRYDDLRSIDLNPNPPPMLIFANDQRGETWGTELSLNFQATERWRLRGGYTYLAEHLWSLNSQVVPGSDTFEADDPHHQFLLQSMLDLPAHFQFDAVARYVAALDGPGLPRVPAYFTFDLRLAWQFKQTEVALVGQNLLENRHPEFGAYEIPRSIYGKVTWRF